MGCGPDLLGRRDERTRSDLELAEVQHQDMLSVMDQQQLITAATDRLRQDPDLLALFLAGSLGRREGDRFSDVDLIAVIAPEAQESFAARWRGLLEDVTPVVFWWTPRGIRTLVSAVTEDWLRCDLFMVAPGGLGERARSTVVPLLDPEGLHATLPDNLPPGGPNPERVRGLVGEFLRVLGLLPVVVGRGEHVVAAQGAGLLRDMLIDLMLEDAALPEAHGALHLSQLLPPEDMATLAALPLARPDRQDTDAHIAICRAFIPRAQRMARALGLDWPDTFAIATERHLEKALGVRLDLR